MGRYGTIHLLMKTPGPYSLRAGMPLAREREMKVRLTARGVVRSGELRDYVRRRVQFSLGRFAGKIKSVSIRLAFGNGPRGGVNQCCDIRVDAAFRQKVIVRERQATIPAAVDLAVERAERSIRRRLDLTAPAGNACCYSAGER